MTTDKHCTGASHSLLLEHFLPQIKAACQCKQPILDLACGFGRNGLYLAKQGLPVIFADKSENTLDSIEPSLNQESKLWAVDLELPDSEPLTDKLFSAIVVFRYLHRPLFEAIKQATVPGGVVVYETFNVEQAALGRPKNPNFLLKPGELKAEFSKWQILHDFEGIDNGSAIAQIVAVKPG